MYLGLNSHHHKKFGTEWMMYIGQQFPVSWQNIQIDWHTMSTALYETEHIGIKHKFKMVDFLCDFFLSLEVLHLPTKLCSSASNLKAGL